MSSIAPTLRREPPHRSQALNKETKKTKWTLHDLVTPDPADPFFPERGDHEILETIKIATEGEDCDKCVRKLRPALMDLPGVKGVKSISSVSA